MTRHQGRVVRSWLIVIVRAIELGDGDAAYRLTRGLVRRLREFGLWSDRDLP
jgi:hypothetical protein